jgi:aryl-alcohol dehydrogenase-like predicted oxidoreductase
METRKLGNSDLQLSRVGFGAWAIGGGGWEFAWGHQEDTDSVAAILRALELGVNWIDTAAVYGTGHSEEVVARALQEWKGKRPYVFTKCTLRWDENRKVYPSHSAESIRQECEDSLRRLKIDAIDLYQMHWPPRDDGSALEEAWQAMSALQQEGKVRWIGVSNFAPSQMERAARIAPVTSNQPPYSIIRRKIETEILPHCLSHGIGVISYAPMASGLLTGAMTRERAAALPPDDFRTRNPEFSEPRLSRNIELVERLRAVGARHGRNPGEVAIAWVLRHPAITGAIVGARNANQAEGVMHAGELRLNAAEIAEIEGAAASSLAAAG